MKKVVIAAIMLAFSSSAFAKIPSEKEELCLSVMELSYEMSKAHMNGAPKWRLDTIVMTSGLPYPEERMMRTIIKNIYYNDSWLPSDAYQLCMEN